MQLNCQFSSCQWKGSEDDIFDHLETYHKKFLREPKGHLFYDFQFEDLQQETFVLCSPNGLYWFQQNLQQPRSDGIDFGVFHIGESEQVDYQLKLGLKRDGHCEYWGSYDTVSDQNINSQEEDYYVLKFDYNFLEIINETMPSRRMRLYFGSFDDSDDKLCPGPESIEWTEEDEKINSLLVERFTCAVCFEYIRHDARFCENKHFICLDCFDNMQQHKKLKCPLCRGQYLYDCANPDVERILRMIKWPDAKPIVVDKEFEEYLRSLPNVEFVKVKVGDKI